MAARIYTEQEQRERIAQRREYERAWRAAHPEQCREYQRRWAEKNKATRDRANQDYWCRRGLELLSMESARMTQ